MAHHLHHVHIFASDMAATIAFYETYFGGVVVLDANFAGARNVFMRIGTGRLHIYDQPPKNNERGGGIHHFGIQTDDIRATVDKLKAGGVQLRKEIADLAVWKYVMVPAPDDILIELFEVDREKLPDEIKGFFEG